MNKHKPIIIIIAIMLLYGAFSVGYVQGEKDQIDKTPTQEKSASTEISASRTWVPISSDNIFEIVNSERVKENKKPLTRDSRLDASALDKCNDLVTRNYWDHIDPDGNSAWHYFTERGYVYSTAGENLARRFATATGTVESWMDSKGHKENIMNSMFRDTGIAVCGNNGNMIVQHFAAK